MNSIKLLKQIEKFVDKEDSRILNSLNQQSSITRPAESFLEGRRYQLACLKEFIQRKKILK